MQMQGNVERVAECTSANFDGLVQFYLGFNKYTSDWLYYLSSVIAMMRPDESWVGKWQRIGKHPCFVGDSIGKEAKAGICTMQTNLHEEYTLFEYLVGYQMM